MISVIITSYKEPKTIGKAIKSILENNLSDYEILVTAPDKETLNEAKKIALKNKKIKLIQDKGEGKPAALNLVVSKSKGDILVPTDGDVFLEKNSINLLLAPFKSKNIGAVSGNPVSLNSKKGLFGYWSYVLTNIANERRKKAIKLRKRIFCSGYLFAIRKSLFSKIPENLFSEDGYISNEVYRQGYLIAYSEKSKVFIKYPNNFRDWILRKKRSAGGYNQIKRLTGVNMRSFSKESQGVLGLFRYVSNPRELFWLFSLFFARIYLWLLIYRDINLKKKSHKEIWKRVESTK